MSALRNEIEAKIKDLYGLVEENKTEFERRRKLLTTPPLQARTLPADKRKNYDNFLISQNALSSSQGKDMLKDEPIELSQIKLRFPDINRTIKGGKK